MFSPVTDIFQSKGLGINNSSFLHLSFRPSLADPQSQNPQRGTTTLAVLLNQIDQICPKSVRQFQRVIDFQTLIFPGHLLELCEGKDRSVLAYILIPDIASATDADTTLHAHLKRKDDPLGREPQFL